MLLCSLAQVVAGQTASPADPGLERAQSAQALRLTPSDRVAVDGRLDEAAWQRAAALDRFFQVSPDPSPKAPVRTEVRFAFDEGQLYVAIKAYDPDPARLRAPLARRDTIEADHDHITLYLDTTGERRFAQFFDINAAGVIADGYFNEQTGTDDPAPNFRFRVATGRFDGGWTIEMAIPFSTLAYQPDLPLPWTVLVTRNYPREDAYYMASGPLPRQSNCTLCYASELLGLAGLPKRMAMQGTATLSARQTRSREAGAQTQRARQGDLGIDIKLRPTTDTTVDLTLRPDFSEVQIDDPYLSGNSRYAIYVPEQRRFFLESADILESALPVLRTRAVASPTLGLRATQRRADWDATVLVVHDRATGTLLLPGPEGTEPLERSASSDILMSRARWHVGPATVGALLSYRDNGRRFGNNLVTGADLSWSPVESDRVTLQWLRSQSSALQRERQLSGRGGALFAGWSHKTDRAEADIGLRQISPGFRADAGFIEDAGLRALVSKWTLKRQDIAGLQEAGVALGIDHTGQLGGPTRFYKRDLSIYGLLAKGLRIELTPWRSVDERVTAASPRRSLGQRGLMMGSVPASWLSEWGLGLTQGDFNDRFRDLAGRGREHFFFARLQPLRQLQAQWATQGVRIRGDGQTWLDERTQRLLVVYLFSTDEHLRLIHQTRRLTRAAGDNLAAARESERALTLSYQKRIAATWLFDAGYTAIRTTRQVGIDDQDIRELFAKLSWDFR